MDELLRITVGIISKHTTVPQDKIHPQSRLYADLNIDSLDLFAILTNIESAFGIVLPDNVRIKTVSDLTLLLEGKVILSTWQATQPSLPGEQTL